MITKRMILDEDWSVWWKYQYNFQKIENAFKELWEKGTDEQREHIMKLLKEG